MGAGAIFYWQKATGRWDSWSYAWPLLVSSMGMGMILSGFWNPESARRLLINGCNGLWLGWSFLPLRRPVWHAHLAPIGRWCWLL
jgi:hypothetical protein